LTLLAKKYIFVLLGMRTIFRTVLFLWIVFFIDCMGGLGFGGGGTGEYTGVTNEQKRAAGYLYLNTIRQAAGMEALLQNSFLQHSSGNYAGELQYHIGVPSTCNIPYFVDNNQGDRATFVGYPTSFVNENIVSSQYYDNGMHKVIDILMSGVYHRFKFLSFESNEVGIGVDTSKYVFQMGNSHMRGLCEEDQRYGAGTSFPGMCLSSISIWEADYIAAIENVSSLQPSIILWPPDSSSSVKPVFYEEVPDPLPDYVISGYPVTVQFNEKYHTTVDLVSFRLFKNSDNSEIVNTRILSKATDPNAQLTDLQFALFPLDLLNYNTTYRAEFSYIENLVPQTLVWTFTTKNPNGPVYTVNTSPYVVNKPAGTHTMAFYIPPTAAYPCIHTSWTMSSSGPLGFSSESSFSDSNTLLLDITGDVGTSVTFNFNSGTTIITVNLN